MPSGDEGTGLHAFDDLDPISTVSALNVMPEPEAPAPQRAAPPRSAPPLLPQHADGNGTSSGVRSAPPPPLPSLGGLPPPPPPRAGAAGRSVPPPPPPRRDSQQTPVELSPPEDALLEQYEEDTKVVPNAFAQDPDYAPTSAFMRPEGESFEDFDVAVGSDDEAAAESAHEAAAPSSTDGSATGIDDTELLELSATTVAANIEMDWDEEEAQTKLRDDGAEGEPQLYAHAVQPLPLPGSVARPSPFPPPPDAFMQANPSPFAGQRAGYAPIGGAPAVQISGGGWEDDAMTTVMLPGSPPPPSVTPGWDSLAPASDATISGERFASAGWLQNRVAWLGLAAAALVGAAFGARTLLRGEESATVTVVTRPADVEVLVNGSPLPSGETSPFTVQGLAADTDHAIVVRKPGYAEQTHHFRIEAGEVMALPPIDLKPFSVDTGFALSSLPEGAEVYVDGAKLAQRTPIRVTDLQPGLHVIRLVHERGYQPWETQVALATGQLIELPAARLVAGNGGRNESRGRSARASSDSDSNSRRSGGGDRVRSRERPEPAQPRALASSSRFGAPAGGSSQFGAPAPSGSRFGTSAFAAAPGPAAGGGKTGSLRLNSRPWSQVYVDGRMMGNTPLLNVPLSAGSHSLKLVNPQLGMIKHLKVKIQAGKTTTKIVDLVE